MKLNFSEENIKLNEWGMVETDENGEIKTAPKFNPETVNSIGLASPMILLITSQILREIDVEKASYYHDIITSAIDEIKLHYHPECRALFENVAPDGTRLEGSRGRFVNPGHAIEARSNFEISHGSAVAIGTVIVTRAAVKMDLCKKGDLEEILALLEAVNLPRITNFTASELAEIALKDKKRFGDTITLIIPFAIGDSRLYKINVKELKDFIQRGLDK